MASSGKLDAEVEVKSSADKFWVAVRDSTTLFPTIFPDQYKSIETIEGDGKSAGSIRLIKYTEGTPLVTFSKEKIEFADDANKTVTYSVIDGDLVAFYKNFKATLQVVPKGDGSLVKWSVEFEKAKEDIPEPKLILDVAVKTFTDLDDHLLKA